jgi:hypothetical protein
MGQEYQSMNMLELVCHHHFLFSGSAVMVESPTYYHALNPVLKSLKRFNMKGFLLQGEVVHTIPSTTLPEYLLSENRSLDASVISTPYLSYLSRWHYLSEHTENRMGVEKFLELFKSNSIKTPLEESQCASLAHALENKLAIIQGTKQYI